MAQGARTLSAPLNICGLVLAGGKSSRMGQDKRFLLYNERFWIDHAIKLLTDSLGEKNKVFVSGKVESERNGKVNDNDNVNNSIMEEPYVSIPDLIPSLGPLMGLYSVITSKELAESKANWILIIPVDMPKMTCENLVQLFPQTHDENQNIEIVKYENEQFPLLIKINKEIINKISILIEDTNSFRSFNQLIKNCKCREIEKKALSGFTNFNQPSDLESL